MKIDQVAVQMFTIKAFLKTPEDVAKSLEKLSAIGYEAVQASNIGPIDLKLFRRLCADNGLAISSTHASAQQLRDEPEQLIEVLDILGTDYTAFPYPAGVDFADAGSVESLIDDLQKATDVLAKAGKVLTYHNHQFEFRRYGNKTLLDRIYDETTIQGELDTYWVQFGGGDSVAWCEKLKNRLPLIHLKDYRINEENQPEFAEIGYGTLDFKRIIDAAENSGCKWFIVEQDRCPNDPFDSLKMSYDYIKENLVS